MNSPVCGQTVYLAIKMTCLTVYTVHMAVRLFFNCLGSKFACSEILCRYPYCLSWYVGSFPKCPDTFTLCGNVNGFSSSPTVCLNCLDCLSDYLYCPSGWLKLGIHLRQRQAEVRHSSLSLASAGDAPSWAACLKGCRNPSQRVSVDQSEVSPRNGSPHAQYGRKNWILFCLKGEAVLLKIFFHQ